MFRPVSVIIRFLQFLLKSVKYCLNRVVMLGSHHRCEVLCTILWEWKLVCWCVWVWGYEGEFGIMGMELYVHMLGWGVPMLGVVL